MSTFAGEWVILLDQVRHLIEWHKPYAGKPCAICLVGDGHPRCPTGLALETMLMPFAVVDENRDIA